MSISYVKTLWNKDLLHGKSFFVVEKLIILNTIRQKRTNRYILMIFINLFKMGYPFLIYLTVYKWRKLDLFDLYGIVLCSREREHMSILKELYYGNVRPSSSRASLSRRVRCDTACTLRGSSSPHRAGASGSPYNRRVTKSRRRYPKLWKWKKH